MPDDEKCLRREIALFRFRLVGDLPHLPARSEALGAVLQQRAEAASGSPTARSPPSAVLLCESAVDALSACLLPAPGLPPGHPLRLHRRHHSQTPPPGWPTSPPSRLLCGFDADPPGDHAARALRLRYPHMRRLRPPSAKDWNDLLRAPLNSPAPAA